MCGYGDRFDENGLSREDGEIRVYLQTPDEMAELSWAALCVFKSRSHIDYWTSVLVKPIDDADSSAREHTRSAQNRMVLLSSLE